MTTKCIYSVNPIYQFIDVFDMAIKVAMLGGCGCGKTSALASMFEQAIAGSLHYIFSVSDITIQQSVNQKTLYDKSVEIRNFLDNSPTCVFMMDSGASWSIHTYTVKVSIAGKNQHIDVDFTNIPGSMLNSADINYQELEDIIIGCDVIFIAIDTPYLMECNESVANAVNRIPEITNLLSYINCETANSSKMVVFMPVKCERWFKENRINEVNDRVKHLYSNLIRHLCYSEFISIGIIPVQTIGNIEFVEMKDTSVSPDCIAKPKAWYKISMSSASGCMYNPHNCNQILLHILDFWTRKIIFLNNNSKLFFYFFPPDFLKYKQLAQVLLFELERSRLIKFNVEGVEYLKQVSFK